MSSQSAPWLSRSSTRPGVPTTTWTPRRSMSRCGPKARPPKIKPTLDALGGAKLVEDAADLDGQLAGRGQDQHLDARAGEDRRSRRPGCRRRASCRSRFGPGRSRRDRRAAAAAPRPGSGWGSRCPCGRAPGAFRRSGADRRTRRPPRPPREVRLSQPTDNYLAARGATAKCSGKGNGRAGQYGSTTPAPRANRGGMAYCRAANPRIPYVVRLYHKIRRSCIR